MQKWLIALCLCIGVVLNGCTSLTLRQDTPNLTPSEPRLVSESRDAGEYSRQSVSVDEPWESWPWDDLPLRLGLDQSRDSGTGHGSSDVSGEAETTPHDATHDVARTWMQPTARALAANTCNERRLRLSPEVANWARMGYRVWHVCYQTPERATSEHPLASRRSSRVTLVYLDDTIRALRDVGEAIAPHLANPWNVNMLIVMPPHVRPFFNLENHYSSTEHLYAVQAVQWNQEITFHGELRLWQVDDQGTQRASPPAVVCLHVSQVTGVEGREYFFVPEAACPGGFESCRLGAYDCRDLIPRPL